MNLGPRPWLGTVTEPYTACGCAPKPKEQDDMRLPTNQEKVQAILDARTDVAEYLKSIGKMEAFAGFSKDEICGLIRAAAEGVNKSFHRQLKSALEDEIPF